MRIGIGYDIHQLVSGRPLILGGVEIDHPFGLLGHSDADVVIHCLIDALLGAASLGDIGDHFPDTDPQYKDIASGALLVRVVEMIDDSGFDIENIDMIIMAQAPKLSSHKAEMTRTLARLVKIDPKRVNIKAKTAEQLGPIGRREAIAAWAATVIRQKDDD